MNEVNNEDDLPKEKSLYEEENTIEDADHTKQIRMQNFKIKAIY